MNAPFNVQHIRSQFPILQRTVNGKPLVYLDNGATTQKPQVVIDAIQKYYSFENSNIHRGVHFLSQEATQAYEDARETIRTHLNAAYSEEIIFTKGTTDAINLVSQAWGRANLNSGDEVIITAMEHHSNIVPWQMICEERKATLRVVRYNEQGELDLNHFAQLLNPRTKMVAVVHVSNSLGTINPIHEMVTQAHAMGALVLVDGAQALPHLKIDVQQLDVDFYCFSGHKVYAPTGIGVLYGKKALLESMPPYQGGGDMIKSVSFEKTTYNDLPFKFEAGTPNIEGGIVLGKALDFVNQIGLEAIAQHENHLLEYATHALSTLPGIRFFGQANHKASLVSFLIGNIHPYDMGVILDKLGIAVRTGHHCTQPIMDHFKIPGTVRASFALYNTTEDIDCLIKGVEKASHMLA